MSHELEEWAAAGDAERVRQAILETPGWEDSSGEALMRAAGNGHVECVELLATQGNSRACDWFVQAALTHAIMSNESLSSEMKPRQEACVLALLDFSNANQGDLNGETPLMHAVESLGEESFALVEKIEARSDAGQKDGEGKTALMHAVAGRHAYPKIVELLAGKRDLLDKDKFGMTALMHAVASRNDKAAEMLLAGSDVWALTEDGRNMLMVAASAGSEVWTRRWIGAFDVESKDVHGRTALMLAAFSYNAACVEMLLLAGADMHGKDRHGASAWKISEGAGDWGAGVQLAMRAHAAREERLEIDAAAGEGKLVVPQKRRM